MRVLFVCAESSVRGDIAAELVEARFGGRVTTRVAVVPLLEPGDPDLVVVLGMDTPVEAATAPTWCWDVAEPVDTLGDDAFDGMRHALRVARLAIEARLGLLEVQLPPGARIQPRANAVEAIAGKVTLARAELEQVGGFAALLLEAQDVALGAAVVADRVCVARLLAIHTVFAVGNAPVLELAGFLPAAQLPADVASAFAARSEPRSVFSLQLADNSSTDALLDADIARELAAFGTLVPPWVKRPDLPRGSLGWRMGSGEWYLWMWQRWWVALAADAREAYLTTWRSSAPAAWSDWLDS